MQVLVIHSTETEDILGVVTPVKSVNFDEFESEVRRTWIAFHYEDVRNRWANDNDVEIDDECEYGGCTIEDFVEFHNANSKLDIDWVVLGFIQQ